MVSSATPDDAATMDRGRAMVIESLELAQARHHTMRVAEARFALGIIAHYTNDLENALRHFRRRDTRSPSSVSAGAGKMRR